MADFLRNFIVFHSWEGDVFGGALIVALREGDVFYIELDLDGGWIKVEPVFCK